MSSFVKKKIKRFLELPDFRVFPPLVDIDHFRSSESLGQRGKVVEHTHKPQDGRRFQPSISFRSKVRGEKRFFRVFQFGSLLDRNFGT